MFSRLGVTLIASVVVTALAAPGAAAHDGVVTAAGHAAEDAVVHTAAQERALDAHTRAVTASDARAAAAAVAGAPQDVGEWGPVVDWPVVGVHVALLPNGKVLAYDSIGDNATETYPVQDHTRATVWDPATGTQTPVNVDTGFNIFCSGLAHLVDGRMFIAGGNKDQQLNGIVQTHLFDPATNLWSLGPNMAAGRWYPTVTPLSNGEMLITSGRVDTPEVRTLAGGLRALSTASLSLPLYPWMDVAPNGRAFYSGPDQTLRALDTTGTGTWQALGQRDTINRDYGGHALFDIGKMLVAGGGPSTKDARVVDFNGATPQVSATAPMAYGRRQHNLTVLADGTVLATGGNSSGAVARRPQRRRLPGRAVEPRHRPVADPGRDADHAPVPLDRAAAARRARPLLRRRDLRHVRPGRLSRQERRDLLAALPLPGRRHARAAPGHRRRAGVHELRRVDGDRDRRTRRRSARSPSSDSAPSRTRTTWSSATSRCPSPPARRASPPPPRPTPTSRRPGSTCSSSSTPTACLPSPAWSASRATRRRAVTLTQPTNGATFTAPATVNLAATASDADGTVTKVEFFNGATKLGEDTTAPYSFTWSGVAAGTYTLTARATDNLGATTTSAASTITVSAGNTPPTATITSPADGAVFAWKPTITVTATASDPDGNVTKVEFRDGTTVLGQDTSAPYSFTWRNVPSGSHVLTARATDNAGAVTTSSPVGITVRPKR